MKRVSVIGCPGAGKTVFSRRLSKQLDLSLIHLDLLYHDQGFQYQTDKVAWRRAVTKLIKQRRWLIDGNYKSTFDIRLPASDTIIFLDYPAYISVWRAVKRRIRFYRKVRADMPETWKEKLGWNFFWFIVRFNVVVAPHIRDQLEGYKDQKELFVFRKPKEAERFLADYSSA